MQQARDTPDQNTAPPAAPAEVEHSGVDVLATLLTGPKRVELRATDYALQSPDFAQPRLVTPVVPLLVQSYTLAPLQFGPAWRPGRITVSLRPVGRPKGILVDTKARMIADLVAQLPSIQAVTPWKRLVQDDPAVMTFARGLADRKGVAPSNYMLKRKIISPAFQIWRSGQGAA
jgi:hypothetical protein